MGNGRYDAALCLLPPSLRRKRYVLIGLLDLFLCRPTSRAVLTVTDGFALDIVEVIVVIEQCDTTKYRKHCRPNQD